MFVLSLTTCHGEKSILHLGICSGKTDYATYQLFARTVDTEIYELSVIHLLHRFRDV